MLISWRDAGPHRGRAVCQFGPDRGGGVGRVGTQIDMRTSTTTHRIPPEINRMLRLENYDCGYLHHEVEQYRRTVMDWLRTNRTMVESAWTAANRVMVGHGSPWTAPHPAPMGHWTGSHGNLLAFATDRDSHVNIFADESGIISPSLIRAEVWWTGLLHTQTSYVGTASPFAAQLNGVARKFDLDFVNATLFRIDDNNAILVTHRSRTEFGPEENARTEFIRITRGGRGTSYTKLAADTLDIIVHRLERPRGTTVAREFALRRTVFLKFTNRNQLRMRLLKFKAVVRPSGKLFCHHN